VTFVDDHTNPFGVRPATPDEVEAWERGDIIHPEQTKHHREFIIGVDVGQVHDPTAAVLLERAGEWGETIQVRGARRLPLGMPYPLQAAHLAEMAAKEPLTGKVHMAVDATGVGRPVVEMVSQTIPCGVTPIVITSGIKQSTDDRGWQHVPKRDLIAMAQVTLEQHVLMVAADLPDLEVFTSELAAYRVTVSTDGHDTYANDAREAKNDDLVLALACGVWCAYRHGWGRVYPMHINRANRYADAALLDADATGMLDLWANDIPASVSAATRRPPGVKEPLTGWWKSP
jgi:hypothetical protein